MNTFIKNSNGLIIGTDPTSYNPTTGAMSSYGMRFGNGAGNSFIDFHSNQVGGTSPDSRIISQNGTTSAYGATLGIQSGTINFSAPGGANFSGTGGVRLNNGFSFNQGYFTSNMIYTGGGQAINRNLGAGSATTEFISFGMTFAPGAIITLAGYASDAASMGVVTNFYGTTTTGFTATFYNSRNVTAPANTWGLNWVAMGPI